MTDQALTISLGYQIPGFTCPGGSAAIFDTVVAQAREAESSGFDTVLLMDHFYRLDSHGAADEPMLSAARRSARWPPRRRPSASRRW